MHAGRVADAACKFAHAEQRLKRLVVQHMRQEVAGACCQEQCVQMPVFTQAPHCSPTFKACEGSYSADSCALRYIPPAASPGEHLRYASRAASEARGNRDAHLAPPVFSNLYAWSCERATEGFIFNLRTRDLLVSLPTCPPLRLHQASSTTFVSDNGTVIWNQTLHALPQTRANK